MQGGVVRRPVVTQGVPILEKDRGTDNELTVSESHRDELIPTSKDRE
jgi:hypothetical protein